MKSIIKGLLPLAAVPLLFGCDDIFNDDDKVSVEPPPDAKAVFEPSSGDSAKLPFPMDLFFSGTVDGSINIPVMLDTTGDGEPDTEASNVGSGVAPQPAELQNPQVALNTMDGFGTTSSMVLRFNQTISPASMRQGGVRVFKAAADDVNDATRTVEDIERELNFGTDFIAFPLQNNAFVVPLRPLESGATYLVVLTDELRTGGGAAARPGREVGADDEYLLAKFADFLVTQDEDRQEGCDAPDMSDCDWLHPPLPGVEEATQIPDGAPQDLLALREQARQLEQLRQQTNAHEEVVAGFGGPSPENIILSYGVTMQDVGSALAEARDKAQGGDEGSDPELSVLPEAPDANPLSSPQGAADVYLATLSDILQFVDPQDPNRSIWKADPDAWDNSLLDGLCTVLDDSTDNLVFCNNFTPNASVNPLLDIPVLISVPNAGLRDTDGQCEDANAAGLPVAIYQHGITTSRGTLMALADGLANACVVGVAIDLPKHGITLDDDFGGIAEANAGLGGAEERLVESSEPDGDLGACLQDPPVENPEGSGEYVCESGDGYINLANLANARDTVRQSVIDLHSLFYAINSGNDDWTNNLGGANPDTGNVHFVGMSLGGIVGMPFVANEDDVQTASINVASGGIAKTLDGSASFEPVIRQGLKERAGVTKPSGEWEAFMIIAQSLMDNTDPVNFTETIGANDRPLLFQQVVGRNLAGSCDPDGEDRNGCPDLVVPSNVYGTVLGRAWGNVSESGQTGFLRGQNTDTTAVALAGTDPLVQGTAFVGLNTFEQFSNPLLDLGANAFFGLGLREIGPEGAQLPLTGEPPHVHVDGGVVRYVAGEHSSLLDPEPNGQVTQAMQGQIASFIASFAGPGPTVIGGTQTTPDVQATQGVVRE